MPATRSRAIVDEDATTSVDEVRVVAQNDPAVEPVPNAHGHELVTGTKNKKKRKANKKGKKGKTAENEEVEIKDTVGKEEIDSPIEANVVNGASGSLGNGEILKEAKIEKTADEDPFIERPATPTVKKEFIAKLPSEHVPTAMNIEDKLAEAINMEPKKTDAAVEVEEVKMDTTIEPAREHSETISQPQIDTRQDAIKFDPTETAESLKSPIESITSHLTSPTIAGPHIEDPIEAIDALEDALEEVGKILPKVDPVSPVKPRATTSKKRLATTAPKPKLSATNPVAPAIGNKKGSATKPAGSSLLKTTQPSATSRVTAAGNAPNTSNIKHTSSQPAKPKTSARPKSIISMSQLTKSTSSDALEAEEEGKSSGHLKRRSVILPPKDTKDRPDYLAAKRRPISMQFPPPPTPIRSAKPPTKPTFVLPSEALEAKRKAARAEREERRKKEEEELQKRREFKARPVPSSVISGAMVKQTASSIKRMSVVIGKVDLNALAEEQDSKSTGPGTCGAGKRASVLYGRPDSVANSAAKRSSMLLSGPSGNKRSSLIVPKRQSVVGTAGSFSASTRGSSPAAGVKTPVTEQDVAAQKVKAKEIYNRDKVEKDVKEKERREKEEAAKKARADAAERGRQASREWAEKQKKRVMAEAAKKKAIVAGVTDTVEAETSVQAGSPIVA